MDASRWTLFLSSIVFISFFAAACGSLPSKGITDATTTSAPTFTSIPPTVLPTSTLEFVPVTDIPTPLPTPLPPPILTPDAIQVERWQEYQTELAKVFFAFDPDHPEGYDPEAYKDAFCEWDILGRSDQQVYVWTNCNSANGFAHNGVPAVIYLEPDGSIREVNTVRSGTDRRTQLAVYDLHLFPMSVQEILCLYYFFGWVPQCSSIASNYVPNIGLSARERVLIEHLDYRRKGHAEEPPLIVFSAIPVETAMPTPQPPLILTPDAIQVERWQEYQTELARVVLSSNPELGYDPVMHKDALCEWDILGQSGQEVYVYAVCVIAKGNGGMRKPAIIYLEPDGTIRDVKLPEPKGADSSRFNYDPFPLNVQEKFCYYFDPFPSDLPRCPNSSMYSSPRLDVLSAHLEYRLTHPEEPPLVILSAPTP